MARNFYIDNINDNDKLNEVSLLLNEMEEVSRIKIGKTGISFYCEDPENVQAVLNNHDENLVLKEEINSRKREFVAPEQKVEHIFMFTNLETEEEAKKLRKLFHDIQPMKMLVLILLISYLKSQLVKRIF